MKEKITVIIFCGIIFIFVFSNCSIGFSGRKNLSDVKKSDYKGEQKFTVSQTEDGVYQLIELSENEPISVDRSSLSLYSLSACMIDGKTGRILFGRNELQERAMASTTKILTCLIALEHCSLDEIVTFSEYAASMPDVQLNAKAGEQFRLYDLLLSLMLESHNDTAVAIAEHVGGNVDNFCNMMTKRAIEIGCMHSMFLTPNGLDKEISTEGGTKKHSTTAYELALIMRECIKNEQFVDICRTTKAMISNTDNSASYQLSNHNKLLSTMNGVIAGKTGFTCDAGYCYIGAVEKNGSVYICALLGCGWPNNKNYKWYDMSALIDFAQEEYHQIKLNADIISDCLPNFVPVSNGMMNGNPSDSLNVVVERNKTDDVLVRIGENVTVSYYLPGFVTAPIKEGDKLGEIQYKISGQTIKTENLTALSTIEQMSYIDYLRLLIKNYIVSGSAVLSSEKCTS